MRRGPAGIVPRVSGFVMEARVFHSLELNRVLAYLAGFSVSEAGFQACLALRPFSDMETVCREAALFEQGRLFVLRANGGLVPFPAVDGLLQFLAAPSGMPDLDDMFTLRGLLSQGRDKAEAMLADPAAREPVGWPLWVARCERLPQPAQCLAALTRCLSDDGLIKDEASPELSLVRGELRRLHRQCARKVKDYAAEYNILHYLQDVFMTLSSDRYVLPLKANFKGRLQGVIHEYSQTGETCYFEPLFLVELNNRLQELKREEREEERKVLLYLSGLAREELPGIRAVYEFLVDLDLLFARAALADCYDGRMVEFAAGRGVALHGARHPLLALAGSGAAGKALRRYEARKSSSAGQALPLEEGSGPAEAARERGKVVPATLELLPGQQALVISGGNAGGKTVCLKTLGLISLMGLCALPVPVEPGSVLPPWREIHAFIGDEQSLDDQVSTFTAQITHLGRIWPLLGPETLVILDEFGAGTDPTQGAALAQAVLDSLMESGSFAAAATHFPALKAYALSTKGVRAASVLFDPGTKKPLFRLVYDQVGASQALDVAREHGLPEPVLRRAEQYLLLSGEDSSSLVERLNALAVEREAELAALAKETAAFSEKRRKLQEHFEAERTRLFESVQAEARTVLSAWKASKLSHKQALKELSRIRGTLVSAPEAETAKGTGAGPDMAGLRTRSRIRHIPWKRTGVLLEVDERKRRVRIDFDGVSLWTDITDVELPDSGRESSGADRKSDWSTGGSGGVSTIADISSPVLPLRLDLRGLRADVAVSKLEKFLDGALISGRDVVEVIHGRGTGILRRELHDFLKSFPAVREYRLAPADQGGDGMTIVELK